MKVNELIARLQSEDGEAEVVIYSDIANGYVQVDTVNSDKKGKYKIWRPDNSWKDSKKTSIISLD